ncbi:MAG: hypothetical protein ACI9OJ_005057 [Myxococcota bacterium]|jgi:hypothetical protein
MGDLMTDLTNSRFTRRGLLRRALGCGTAGLLGFAGAGSLSRLALAAEAPATLKDRYFVFAYFNGGWDILLGLDPRDPIAFSAGNSPLTKIHAAYELLDDDANDGTPVVSNAGVTFGPYIGDLANHGDKLAVVRGMSMDTLTHEVGRRRFITGKPPSGLQARGSSAATWFASMLGEVESIPNLSVRVESYNIDQPNFATGLKVASVPDLIRALKPQTPGLDPKLDMLVDQMLAHQASCTSAERSRTWQKAEESRGKARQMVGSGFHSLFDFQSQSPMMAELRDHYGIAATGSAALQSAEAQAATAATALKSGISRVVSFTAAVGLDTHYDEWATDQGPTQQRGFNSVARLVEDLENSEYKNSGSSWLDHTTIVGFSEFSRTALLNARGGRDHALTNACFLLGAGIKGGTAAGASSDAGLLPQPMNLATGLVDPGGEVVLPEHVIRALFHDIGVTEDIADLRADPLTAILKTP